LGAVDLHKLGPIGLLLILTASLAIFTVPGTFGAVVTPAANSPEQATGAVVVTVLDCGGNRIANAVVQVRGLSWSQWIYTGDDGVATIIAPVGTYTVQGGYGNFPFSQTITVGTGGVSVTVNVGPGCSSSSSSSSSSSTSSQTNSNTGRISR
jgi:hypothetical protein